MIILALEQQRRDLNIPAGDETETESIDGGADELIDENDQSDESEHSFFVCSFYNGVAFICLHFCFFTDNDDDENTGSLIVAASDATSNGCKHFLVFLH